MAPARVALAATFALAAAAVDARAADDFFPTFGNDRLDVRHYELQLDVDAARHALAGLAVLDVRAKARLESFTLDLSGLTVDSVRVDGVTARFARRPGKLEVRPATALAADRERRRELRATLRRRLRESPMGDGPSFARGFFGLLEEKAR